MKASWSGWCAVWQGCGRDGKTTLFGCTDNGSLDGKMRPWACILVRLACFIDAMWRW